MDIDIYATIFTKRNQFGDFQYMIGDSRYDDGLFIFNDNEEHHETDRRGAGNAVIRPYNVYSEAYIPRSAGIPTGTMKHGGYTEFNEEIKKTIDDAFEEIIGIIQNHKYKKIYYSAEKNGLLGTNIFYVHPKVLKYITWKIQKLSIHDIKIITEIKLDLDNLNDDVDDDIDDDVDDDVDDVDDDDDDNNE